MIRTVEKVVDGQGRGPAAGAGAHGWTASCPGGRIMKYVRVPLRVRFLALEINKVLRSFRTHPSILLVLHRWQLSQRSSGVLQGLSTFECHRMSARLFSRYEK
jgi:hypothetical protein